MKYKTKDTSPDSFLNLDPFIDIVANVIGAFFFVIIYIVLSSSGVKSKITTPLVSKVDTKPVYFECRNKTVFFPDIEGLTQQSNEVWKKTGKEIPDWLTGFEKWSARVEKLKNAYIFNDFYTYIPEPKEKDNGNWEIDDTFEPIPDARGETTVLIKKDNSLFRRRLSQIDSTKYYIYFFVRSDSFEAFHAARQITIKKGFRVGWEPREIDESIGFCTGCREIGPQ